MCASPQNHPGRNKGGLWLCWLAVVFCWPPIIAIAQNSDSLLISGSTTIQPTAELAADLFADRYGNRPTIVGGGSSAGLRDAVSGASDLGMMSRALTREESGDAVAITYGFDALVFIVNEANPITALRKPQIQSIFTGSAKSWSAVSDWNEEILLVSKEMGRATLDLFEGYADMTHPDRQQVGSGGRISSDAFEIASNLEALTLVGGLPQAIGYVSLGAAINMREAGMPIKLLTLDGVEPTQASIVAGTYPILRELNFVALEQNLGRVEPYIELLFSPELQRHIQDIGAVPASR